MKYLIKTFLILILLNGCGNHNKEPLVISESNIRTNLCEKISISGEFDNRILYDSIFQSIEIVPLETRKGCLIDKVKKVVINNEHLYIQNSEINILIFDLNGKFIKSIGKKGRGPGEILSLRDFEIVKDEIFILDFQSIKKYTLRGDFVDQFDFKFFTPKNRICCNPLQFSIINGSYYFFGGTFAIDDNSDGNLFALYQLNEKFKIQERYFPLKYKLTEDCHRFSKSSNGIVSISPPFGCNDIYEIDSLGLRASYHVDFNDKQMSLQIPSNFESLRDFKTEMDVKYAHSIKNVIQTNSWVYFTFGFNRYRYNVFYSKENKSSYVSQYYPRLDDKLVPFQIDGVYNDELIALMPSKVLLDDLKKMKSDIRNKYISDESFSILSEVDNPILYRCKMK